MQSARIEQLLRIMVAALVMLATIQLGIGEHSATLSLISLAMLAIAAYVTDITGVFRLRQSVANCAALGIVIVSAANASQIDRPGQLQAVADLQSYLQYVLLFQPKTPRVYWQLAALSLGQVAIASTLVPGPLFGIMLVAYVLVGIVTFALLLLHTEFKRFEALASSHGAAEAPNSRARLTGRTPVLVGHAAAADPRDMGWGLLRQSLFVTTTTAVLATVLFLLLPRWKIENREIASREPLRSVGFSKSVTLGELGEVVNNPDVVMRVKLTQVRGNDRRPLRLIGEPLFRGTVVTRYDNNRWTQPRSNSPMQLSAETKSEYVCQQITAEPLDESALCCIYPVFGLQNNQQLRINSRRDYLVRQEDSRDVQLEFEIGTTGIQNDRQLKIIPCEPRLGRWEVSGLLQMPGERGSEPFAGLRATAAAVLRDQNIDPTNRVEAAKALSQFLSGSGKFFYSLEPQQRDKSLDPLEDFVTTHRYGHCEYFAGALVMMLRSQGIPARMAIGFKGGEWNSLGMYYQVQQLHAHSWVEAYLDPEGAPPEKGGIDARNGSWLVLDPTEGAQETNLTAINRGLLGHVRQYLDYGRVLWANYVVGLNARRQQESIYGPISVRANEALDAVFSPEAWKARGRAVANSPLGVFWEWYRRHWFSWRGGLVAAGFCLLALALYLLAQWILGALRRWGLVPASRFQDDRPVLEMYRRLEAALARQGLRRHAGQTAYEFAVAAGGEMAESVEHRRLSALPRRVVEMFYRVRFGGLTLDNVEAEAVEHALVELELAPARSR